MLAVLLIASHARLLRLPYFWDEAGYYIPAARDLLAGSLIPHSTPSNAHPPLVITALALAWKLFGQRVVVTRCAMLLLSAFSLLGFFRLAHAVSNRTVALWSTLLVAIYPVFFAQSSLAQVDLPAAGLTFWGLEAYVRHKPWPMAIWFSLAALAKETAILVPIALFLWELTKVVRESWQAKFGSGANSLAHRRALRGALIPLPQRTQSSTKEHLLLALWLIATIGPLALWYAYHFLRTGFVFGNPEFFRYNVQSNLHPLRIVLALLLRMWQTAGYLNLYVLTLACVVAMKYPPSLDRKSMADNRRPKAHDHTRERIDIPIQLAFLAIAIVYLLTLSILGGAVLARYMLPITPLFILICVSTVWRRLRVWKLVLAIVAVSFVAAIFVNPPYGFAPEDNLAYRDYVRLHQRAEQFLVNRYPHAPVLTAWPASDELSRPYLGYVAKPIPVVRIEDFTAEQLLPAADARSQFDVALVFSTKYQPPNSLFDRWRLWQEWKRRYFGYHVDLSPSAAASVLGGSLVYVEYLRGQWVGVIEMQRIEEARIHQPPPTRRIKAAMKTRATSALRLRPNV